MSRTTLDETVGQKTRLLITWGYRTNSFLSPQLHLDFFCENLGSTGPDSRIPPYQTILLLYYSCPKTLYPSAVSTAQQFPARREAIDQRPHTLRHLRYLWMFVTMDVAAARICHVFLLAVFAWCVFVGGEGYVAYDHKVYVGDVIFPWKPDTTGEQLWLQGALMLLLRHVFSCKDSCIGLGSLRSLLEGRFLLHHGKIKSRWNSPNVLIWINPLLFYYFLYLYTKYSSCLCSRVKNATQHHQANCLSTNHIEQKPYGTPHEQAWHLVICLRTSPTHFESGPVCWIPYDQVFLIPFEHEAMNL